MSSLKQVSGTSVVFYGRRTASEVSWFMTHVTKRGSLSLQVVNKEINPGNLNTKY